MILDSIKRKSIPDGFIRPGPLGAKFAKVAGMLCLSIGAIDGHSGAVGFGRLATGGAGGREVVVSTAEELLKAAASEEPMIITVKGKLVHYAGGGGDDDRIWVASNKTIQGADANASVDGNFSNARENEGCSNIIIRNIHLSNPDGKGTGDAIEFTNGVTNIWVDHVTFGQCKDGALDFKRGADLATVSWCKFAYTSETHQHNYANLVGHSDLYPELDRGKLRVTFHHNWWADNVIERMPRVRYGQVHVFNNYYSSTRTNYNVGVGVEAQILMEANYFKNQNGAHGTWFDWYPANKCEVACEPGKIQWTEDNIFENTTVSTWAANSDVFDPPYPYTLDKAENVPAIVMGGAGVQGGPTALGPILSQPRFGGGSPARLSCIKASRFKLDFHLQEASNLRIVLFDNRGKIKAEVWDGVAGPGFHSLDLDSYRLPQGVYYADFNLNSNRKQSTILKD